MKLPEQRISMTQSKACGLSSVPQSAVCTGLLTKAGGIMLSEAYSALHYLARHFKPTSNFWIMLCKVYVSLEQIVSYHKRILILSW